MDITLICSQGWDFARTKYTKWTHDNPIEFSDEEDDGRPNKKTRVTTYPLRVVLFVKVCYRRPYISR